MKFKILAVILCCSFGMMFSCRSKPQNNDLSVKKPNILFIIVDDLKPELGSYGHADMVTPHIDQLANDGIKFTNAFANVPVCGASRASLLTGVYPTRQRFLSYDSRADVDIPNAIPLHEHLSKNGYNTYSLGKVFHKPQDHAEKWSTKPWLPDVPNMSKNYYLPKNIERQNQPKLVGPAYEREQVDDDFYADGKISIKAIQTLDSLQNVNSPFFLAVGFNRPHLPFTVPKKYWDMYDERQIKLPANYYWPNNTPLKEKFNFEELRKYQHVPKAGPIPDSLALKLVHGYKASVSYVDAMIGNVINKLKATGQYDETLIIVLGDHGFLTGEHGLWCKHVTFDNALRVPLIIKMPEGIKNKQVNGLVEFVDIYPTLCDITGITKPKQLEGETLFNVLKKQKVQPSKEYVFARYENMETIKTKNFSYTQFIDKEANITDEWLFNHSIDPEENNNIANQRGYLHIKNDLKIRLNKHIKQTVK